jgi:outer membrane lipoprotein carrier protein
MNNEQFIVHGLSFIVITLESERLTRMKKTFLSMLAFSFSSVVIFLPVAFCATGQEVLNEVQNRYEKTNDLEANFIQESIGKVMKKPQRGEGKVYLKKKGMMRWDYRTPNQKLISDGQTLWYYQPDENQVLVYDVSKVLKEKIPLAFLSGEGDLSRDFNILNLKESIFQKEEHFILELAPKEPWAALTKLTLTVDKKTYFVVQADVFDVLGNLTRTRFTDIKTNVALPNFLFLFTIPPGAEVVQFKEPSASPGGKGTQSN